MLEPVLPTVLDLLVRDCLIVSVSSFLIMLALQPLLPGGNVATAASRGVCSASRAVLVRLLSGRSDGDGGGGAVAVAPPPPRQSRSSRHCCERCAASSWPDVVAAVTASLRLDDDDDMECSNSSSGDENEEEDTAAACGGCAAMAAVEDLLERKEATEQELREAFYVFDRDDDGFVGAGELWNVLRRLGMQLPDGAAAREDCCARMIAAHDGDGDGRISFPEFRAMMEHAA
ncbi:uncharacterized protein [Miscanthus floridulus]|uniref:uncharacterized protein n=1 Tax=Miscanthus floridulus TaxID=154761 RepID=UPI00345B2AE4